MRNWILGTAALSAMLITSMADAQILQRQGRIRALFARQQCCPQPCATAPTCAPAIQQCCAVQSPCAAQTVSCTQPIASSCGCGPIAAQPATCGCQRPRLVRAVTYVRPARRRCASCGTCQTSCSGCGVSGEVQGCTGDCANSGATQGDVIEAPPTEAPAEAPPADAAGEKTGTDA